MKHDERCAYLLSRLGSLANVIKDVCSEVESSEIAEIVLDFTEGVGINKNGNEFRIIYKLDGALYQLDVRKG